MTWKTILIKKFSIAGRRPYAGILRAVQAAELRRKRIDSYAMYAAKQIKFGARRQACIPHHPNLSFIQQRPELLRPIGSGIYH